MKLVLRDYIESLKEDGELDHLISELLLNLCILPLSKPQRGRQHGVDIAAVGYDSEDKVKKIFLFAVKMGNIDRVTWDGTTNAIRSTLNEILDTYITTHIQAIYKDLPIRVIVASNGILDSNVAGDWTNFTNKNSTDKISFDYWGLEALTLKVEAHLLNGKLFPEKTQNLLKKTLVFLEVSDYDLSHFYELINDIYSGLDVTKKKINRANLRLFRAANLCLNIVFQRGKEIDNLKPVIYASERLLLVTWGMITKHDLESKGYTSEYFSMMTSKEHIDAAYFAKVRSHFHIDEGLSRGISNHVEYGLNTFEQIGIISNIGIYHLNLFEILAQSSSLDEVIAKAASEHYRVACVVAEDLVNLVFNNPGSYFPLLDDHLIEVNSALTLLFLTEKKNEASHWINTILNNLISYFRIYKTYPQFNSNVESLFKYYFAGKKQKVDSSTIFVLLAEWAIILEKPELYKKLSQIINKNYKSVNLQIWFPEKEIETDYYFKNVSAEGSTKHSIKLHGNPLEYEAEMAEERAIFNVEKDFYFNKHSLTIIAYWASRHYRTPPFPNLWRNHMGAKFCFNPDSQLVGRD